MIMHEETIFRKGFLFLAIKHDIYHDIESSK
jgi:hypothetical protein